MISFKDILLEKSEEILSPGLVFKTEELRDNVAKWLQNPSNYSKKALESKSPKPPFTFELKDSTGIVFPTNKNSIDPERLKKIVENLSKKINPKIGAEVTEFKNE